MHENAHYRSRFPLVPWFVTQASWDFMFTWLFQSSIAIQHCQFIGYYSMNYPIRHYMLELLSATKQHLQRSVVDKNAVGGQTITQMNSHWRGIVVWIQWFFTHCRKKLIGSCIFASFIFTYCTVILAARPLTVVVNVNSFVVMLEGIVTSCRKMVAL